MRTRHSIPYISIFIIEKLVRLECMKSVIFVVVTFSVPFYSVMFPIFRIYYVLGKVSARVMFFSLFSPSATVLMYRYDDIYVARLFTTNLLWIRIWHFSQADFANYVVATGNKRMFVVHGDDDAIFSLNDSCSVSFLLVGFAIHSIFFYNSPRIPYERI